jgi:hypothetical protein
MFVDYTQYFRTPDELVEFLLLDNDEQDRRLTLPLENDSDAAKEMACDLEKQRGR